MKSLYHLKPPENLIKTFNMTMEYRLTLKMVKRSNRVRQHSFRKRYISRFLIGELTTVFDMVMENIKKLKYYE